MHYRIKLRNDIGAILNGAGIKTFIGRVSGINESDLPCVIVVTMQEDNAVAAMGKGQLLRRDCQLSVIIYDIASDGVFDRLDEMCASVETLLMQSGVLPQAKPIVLRSTTMQSEDAPDGAPSIAMASMLFDVTVYTPAGLPAVTR